MPAGASALASATTWSMTAAHRVVLGAPQRALQAVEARQRHAGRLTEHLGEKGGRPARHHRDQRERAGELGQQGRHAGQRAGPRRVLHDGGQGPVEVEEQRAVRRLGGHAPEGAGSCAAASPRHVSPARGNVRSRWSSSRRGPTR